MSDDFHEETEGRVPLLRRVRRGGEGRLAMKFPPAEATLPDGTQLTIAGGIAGGVIAHIGGATYTLDVQDIAQAVVRQWEADGRPSEEPDRGQIEPGLPE